MCTCLDAWRRQHEGDSFVLSCPFSHGLVGERSQSQPVLYRSLLREPLFYQPLVTSDRLESSAWYVPCKHAMARGRAGSLRRGTCGPAWELHNALLRRDYNAEALSPGLVRELHRACLERAVGR